MASIVSKLARAAAVAYRRTPPTAVGGGKRSVSPICRPVPPGRFDLAGRRMCSDAGEKKGSEKDGPKPSGSAAAAIDRITDLLVSSAEALESDETMWALYERWCKYVGKPRDRARFRLFMGTARLVHKVNSSGVSYKLALNQFSDLTREEIERTYCCNNARSGVHQRRHLPDGKNTSEEEHGPDSEDAAAATIDPRTDLLVTTETLESDETLWALYEPWSKYYWKSRSPAETKRRFKTFKKTTDELLRNLNNSDAADRLFLFENMTRNEFLFENMTRNEFRRTCCGYC